MFTELGLDSKLLKTIEEMGFSEPTPIQAKAIPKVLKGMDIQASAQTGTGKTAAFLLPALDRLINSPSKGRGGPRVLILAPTRELAMQIATEAKKFSKNLDRVNTVCIYGGVPYPKQYRELKRPYEILIATPGRLMDHMERGRIKLNNVEMMILDEADRMLDMGFVQPVKTIAAATSEHRQTLLFSATLKGNVLKLSQSLLRKPMVISVAQERPSCENIEQRLHYADNVGHKQRMLEHLLDDPELKNVIIFTATKRFADELSRTLGSRASALHGDMNQRQRTRTLASLKRGEIHILVATDVAARGIDVNNITHVINFDLPNCVEDYVHRIGRTGRAGMSGIAISFAAGKDRQLVKGIERYIGEQITPHTIPGMEPRPSSQQRQRPGPNRKPGNGKPFNKKKPHYAAKKSPYNAKKKPFKRFKKKAA